MQLNPKWYEHTLIFREVLKDNGGRRAGFDRRHFSYTDHVPERRNVERRRIDCQRKRSNSEN